MCGRFTLTGELAEIAERIAAGNLKVRLKPRFNVCPSQDVAVTLNIPPHQISLARWGLIPVWAKDPKIGNSLANARAEGIESKPSFRTPFKQQRCLVFADGFYEWTQTKPKTPHYFRMKSNAVFAFAGLWDTWRDPSGSELTTCCLITTTPNSLLEKIHNRMPVILAPKFYDPWLAEGEQPVDELLKLLKPYPENEMVGYPVATIVNKPQNDVPECIQPVVPD